eukprot:Rhum_TRINITY_DN15187_c11_g1::Rhum_TRINITY_DN15187_c11_g1_i1::g.142747::m.142747
MAAATGVPATWVVSLLAAASCALRAAAQEAAAAEDVTGSALLPGLPPPDVVVLDEANSTAPHARHTREGFDAAMWTAAAAVVAVALAALACAFFGPSWGSCCGRRQGLDDDLTGDGAGKQEVMCVDGYVNASTSHAGQEGADIPLIG